jgi:DNA processing protein
MPKFQNKTTSRKRIVSRTAKNRDRDRPTVHVAAKKRSDGGRAGARYVAPSNVRARHLRELVTWSGRGTLEDGQLTLLAGRREHPEIDIFAAGDVELLRRPCVSVVGTRLVSDDGWSRARRLARELAEQDIVVVSGLAKGVDTAALTGAIAAGGRVVAVIGTPIDEVYPIENAELQQAIYRDHLLISQFPPGERVFPSNFPKRNRVMAALSDATAIVEASDTSGTLHQAAECQRLGRWLFIMRSVAEDRKLKWPAKFVGKPKVVVLDSTAEILDVVRRS